MQLVYMYMDSPVGALKLVAHDQALVADQQQDENVLSLIQQFFSTALARFKQWIKALRNKQD